MDDTATADPLAELRQQFHQSVADNIERFGQNLLGVAERLPFTYSIGNHKDGLPELLVFAVPPTAIYGMMNLWCAEQRRRGKAFADGEVFAPPTAACPVRFHAAPDWMKHRYSIQAGQYWKTQDYGLLWVEIPDPDGRWTDDPGCSPMFATQAVMAQAEGVH